MLSKRSDGGHSQVLNTAGCGLLTVSAASFLKLITICTLKLIGAVLKRNELRIIMDVLHSAAID
jgi:hypothetical protein